MPAERERDPAREGGEGNGAGCRLVAWMSGGTPVSGSDTSISSTANSAGLVPQVMLSCSCLILVCGSDGLRDAIQNI